MIEKDNVNICEGMQAPDFSLPDENNNIVSVTDLRGKKIILYFYPKDSTPGCTRQALGFAENFDLFAKSNTAIIGINKDSVASHQRFALNNSLPFTLLSDTELETVKSYGVWREKKNCGKVSMGIVRTTFIIDENGVIEKIFDNVKVDGHVDSVLEYLGISK